MSELEKTLQAGLAIIKGKVVKSASSSLTRFAIKFEDDLALLLEADKDKPTPLTVSLLKASDLSEENEAVCKVDWTWIQRATVSQIFISDSSMRFQLNPAGPLSVTVQIWQGAPFLAFQPYKAL